MEIELRSEKEPNHLLITSNIDNIKNTAGQNWFSKRYLLAFTLLLAVVSMYSLRVNFSIAIIEMTKNRTIEINGTVYNQPEFNWNSKVKGLVLSMNSWGDFASIAGALIVRKFGGITSHGFGMLLCGIINILHPFAVRLNFYLFLVMRVLEGIFQVLTFVSTFEIWSKWALKKDRCRMLSIQFTGVYIGNAVVFPITGYIAHTWHWPAIFYFTGGIATLFSIILLSSFANDPLNDKHVSMKERKYLMQEFQESVPQEAVPWKAILSSKPLWALVVVKLSYASGYSFMILALPLYIKDTSNLEIHDVGVLSGIPNVAGIISVPLSGYLADHIQNKELLTPTQMHKTFITIGNVLGAVCLFVIAIQPNFTVNIALLIIFKVLLSMSFLATLLVISCMAPHHSSIVASFSSFGYYSGTMLTPLLVGFVVTSHWSICLTLLGTIILAGSIIFLFFGSSDPQPWSRAQCSR